MHVNFHNQSRVDIFLVGEGAGTSLLALTVTGSGFVGQSNWLVSKAVHKVYLATIYPEVLSSSNLKIPIDSSGAIFADKRPELLT